jgi:transcriptional regulator with GAF, ATPase, and Fis domain
VSPPTCASAPELGGSLEGVGSLVCVPLNFPSQALGMVYVDRFSENLHGAFKQRDLNLLAVLANTAAVAIVEAQRSLCSWRTRSCASSSSRCPASSAW